MPHIKGEEEDCKMAASDGGSVRTLQKHIEDMRSLVMCKICLKPFYEPYILACGHTYCYGCLNSWFTGSVDRRKNNKNCPDCRTVVKVQPAPNYLLRDLTHMFIGRIELLPEDETVEEHVREKDEEAQLLTTDRNGRGLFGGLFKYVVPRPIMPYAPIQDFEDGVMRCPECAWEIEDGICMGCGLGLPGQSDVSLSDLTDSMEDDISSDSDSDDESVVSDLPMPVAPVQQFYGEGSDSDDDEDDTRYGGSQDPDAYDFHDDFVDDDNEVDADDMGSVVEHHGYPSEPSTPYSDDSPRSHSELRAHAEFAMLNRSFPMWDSDAEEGANIVEGQVPGADDDDEDIRPASRPRRVAHQSGPVLTGRRRPVVISDEEEEEEEDAEDDDREEDHTPSPEARVRALAPAPAPFSETEGSSDDEEDNEDGPEFASSDSDSDSDSVSSDSDDTVIAPQSRSNRRQRLEAHRARRPAPSNRVAIDLVTPPHDQYQRGRARPRGGEVARAQKRSRVSAY